MTGQPYDVGVIGGGPGGYVAALASCNAGLKTVLIEKERLGGVCLNWGCIPTKGLLKSAQLWHELKDLEDFGISISSKSFNLETAVKRSRSLTDHLSKGIEGLLSRKQTTIKRGHGKILGREGDLFVLDVDSEILKVRHVIIATGASGRGLPFPIPESFLWNAKQAMTPTRQPEKLLIIGAGAIGLEFADFYNSIGTHVTVVEQGSRILPTEDAELTTMAQKIFQKKGIHFALNHTLAPDFTVEGDRIKGTIQNLRGAQHLNWEGDKILVAIGVVGRTQDLGLEHTQVKVEKGYITTTSFSQTHEPGIYAIGDVAGGMCLAHKASAEAISCVSFIAGQPAQEVHSSCIPGCIYTSPSLASVGLTEEQALAQEYKVKIGRFPFSANGQALAQGAGDGLVKLVFEEETGELLGAHLLGKGVTELIGTLVTMKSLEGTLEDLAHVIFPHPTLSEMIGEAAHCALGKGLHI